MLGLPFGMATLEIMGLLLVSNKFSPEISADPRLFNSAHLVLLSSSFPELRSFSNDYTLSISLSSGKKSSSGSSPEDTELVALQVSAILKLFIILGIARCE